MMSDNRKPPVEYQFKKGRSGNQKGRPPKKVKPTVSIALGGEIADRLSAMALEEAMRLVTVREGDKVSELPAIQALLRTMYRVAAKGDAKAGRQLLEVLSRAEAHRATNAMEMLRHANWYKETYLPTFEKHEREGLDPPDIYPHPDDIIINELTGEVTIDGPSSREEAGGYKVAMECAIERMPRYFEVLEALKKDPKNRELKREHKELKGYHDFILKEGNRNLRREGLRLSRRALEAKPKKAKKRASDPKP